MNYFDKNLTADIVDKMVSELRANNDRAKEAYFDELDDYWYNRVADDGFSQAYFPKLANETQPEFDAREKMGIPWARIFSQYQNYYYWYGNTTYEWQPKKTEKIAFDEDREPTAEEKEANLLNDKLFEVNDYHAKKFEYLTTTFRYGCDYLKPDFARYNIRNGEEIKVDGVNGSGMTLWQEIKPYYVTPIYHPKFHDQVQAVVIDYIFDGNGEYKMVKENLEYSANYERRLEYISRDSYYTTKSGKQFEGMWRAWVIKHGKKDWEEIPNDNGKVGKKNPYQIMPINFWETWDGESIISKAKELINRYNLEISTVANALKFMGFPMLSFRGLRPKGGDLQTGPNRILYTGDPTGSQYFEILEPGYNEGPANMLLDKLERFLSFVFSVPLEVLNGIAESKSGIQLEMLFTSLVQLRQHMQMSITRAEQQYMWNSLYIWEMENGGKHKYTDVLKPVVTYEENIVPANKQEELTQDIIKMTNGLTAKEDGILKYNTRIDNFKDAQKFKQQTESEQEEQADKEAERLKGSMPLNRFQKKEDKKPPFNKQGAK